MNNGIGDSADPVFFDYVTQILMDMQALFSDAIMAPSHRARC